MTTKERPILFSGPLVRAILDGRKVQTRRIIKPQPPEWIESFGYTAFTPEGHISGRGYWKGAPGDEGPGEKFFRCPYGKPGDLLWVRETWGTMPGHDHVKPSDFAPNGVQVYYRADNDKEDWRVERWRPSIFMPRWASRITLRVTGVRVERVQEITVDDAYGEGVSWVMQDESAYPFESYREDGDPIRHPVILNFRKLWDEINAGRGCGWDANPWVWVVEFEKVEG